MARFLIRKEALAYEALKNYPVNFHNLLKTKLFPGKRNQHLDDLLYTITGSFQDHFRRKDQGAIWDQLEKI